MKKFLGKICFSNILLGLLIAVFCFSTLCISTPQNVACAEQLENIPVLSDLNSYFSVKTTANSRKSQKIYYENKTVNTSIGENITYLAFKWSDLYSLSFSISANMQESENEYTYYDFSASFFQTDDLSTPTTQMKTKTLVSSPITNKRIPMINLTYYIDSNTEATESDTTKIGNDFGIYKFNFTYKVIIDEITHQISLDSLYIAILPDNIDTISTANLKILKTVTSSNKLMNVFNLKLSRESAFKYVNPAYIQWSIIGKDINNVNYILTQDLKDSSPTFANYRIIWESQLPTEPTGTSFLFDSNDIEGTWIAYCTILNSDGTTREVLQSEQLSTIKVERKSYTLMIVLIVLGVAVLSSVVGLIVFIKKRK